MYCSVHYFRFGSLEDSMNINRENDPASTYLPNGHSSKESIESQIQAALLENIYKHANFGLGASILSATIILIGLYETPNRIMLISWYGVFLGISSFRFISTILYHRETNHLNRINFWKTSFTTGSLLAGLCWGFLASFLLPLDNIWQLSLTIFIIAGMTSGAVPLLSGIKGATYGFISATLIPLIIRFLVFEESSFNLVAVALLIYYTYLIILAARTHQMIKNTIALQFENDHLLLTLSKAKKELEETNLRLEHAARHDPLTNLANRSLFEISFENAIWRAHQESKILALLYLDIDNFKDVNDAYGHHVGDQLLQKVVERIKRKLPKNVIASRLGGDELTIILENVNQLEEVSELCQKICETTANPFEIKNFKVSVTTSIGVSFYPVDGLNSEMLVKVADKAMYQSKEEGGNRFRFNTDFTTLKFAFSNAFKPDMIMKSIKND